MKKILYVFIGFLVATVWACNQADPSDVAAHAAKQYYDYLLEDKYEAFVDGQYRPNSNFFIFARDIVLLLCKRNTDGVVPIPIGEFHTL